MKSPPRNGRYQAEDKRVLMVISELARGGVERQMLTLSDGLLSRGYEVQIFELAGNAGGESSFEAELSKLGIRSRRASDFVEITELGANGSDDHGLVPLHSDYDSLVLGSGSGVRRG
jgi:hypothetical protein